MTSMEACNHPNSSQFNGFCIEKEHPPPSEGTSEVSPNLLINSDDKPSLLQLHTAYQKYYRDKLTAVEKNGDSDATDKIQLAVLRNYLEQLEDLNSVLIKTMIELQNEVEERVAQMERRLKSSAKTTMEAVINLHECEQEMSRLVKDRLHMESLIEDMQHQVSSVVIENNFLRDQNFNFIHDIQALLHIIQHARSTGHWEVDCVTFCEVTPEQVFGPVQSLDNFHTPIVEDTKLPVPTENDVHTSKKCLSHEDQHMNLKELPASKNSLIHSFSLPVVDSSLLLMNSKGATSKSDPLCWKQRDQLLSKSMDIFHMKSMVQKGAMKNSSCEIDQRSYESYLRRAYSEPHLFIYGDNIYVYRPCESVNQELSHFPQEEDCKLSVRACQSIDLKLPSEDLACKYMKSCKKNLFYNSKVLPAPNSSSLPCNMEQISLSSCTSNSDDNSIVNGGEEYSSHYCKCMQNTDEIDSNPAEELRNPYFFGNDEGRHYVSCHVQTDSVNLLTVGLQTNICNADSESTVKLISQGVEECLNVDAMNKDMQELKLRLLRAEDEVCAQVILIKELQTHLNTVMKELECKEDTVKEFESQEKVLQDHKRLLMIQLDAQGDELECKRNELEIAKHQLQNSALQVEQQSIIIKSLQEALVQSKRALDERKVGKHVPFVSNSGKFPNESMQTSRNSVVNL